MRIIVCGDSDHLTQRAAEHISQRHADCPGAVSFGLAGGSTPKPIYEQLTSAQLDWSRTVLWLGDERWVPPDHADSNTGMADRLLARHVPARFLPFPYAADRAPEEAAIAYGAQIVAATPPGARRMVLLGMGDDGHTASLFPGTDALEASGTYVASWVESKDTWRVTATLGYLSSSDELIFVVSGGNKASALAAVVAGDDRFPAGRLVRDATADITFIVDAAAAVEITGATS